MEISGIYQKYDIMPQLREHMLRVAGIGLLVAQAWVGSKVDVDLVIAACLLHDMGNILKFNDLSEKSAKEYGYKSLHSWLEIQAKSLEKYGNNVNIMTDAICNQLSRDDVVVILEEERRIFTFAHDEILSASPESQILLYADLRVTPRGVRSSQRRINDLVNRYPQTTSEFFSFVPDFEKYIQRKTRKFDVKKISEEQVRPLFQDLKSVTI